MRKQRFEQAKLIYHRRVVAALCWQVILGGLLIATWIAFRLPTQCSKLMLEGTVMFLIIIFGIACFAFGFCTAMFLGTFSCEVRCADDYDGVSGI